MNSGHIKKVALFGASSCIAIAIAEHLLQSDPEIEIYTISRKAQSTVASTEHFHVHGYKDEAISKIAESLKTHQFDLIVVTNGILHQQDLQPEKTIRNFDVANFLEIMEVNAAIPALIAKHFLPLLNKDQNSIFAVLSARVGSISDNHIGGWYSYRASKAALNMLVRTASIELKRKSPKSLIVGLHPGTVDTPLSKPFQGNVAAEKLFTPEFSAAQLVKVLETLNPEDSGSCFAWDGQRIDY